MRKFLSVAGVVLVAVVAGCGDREPKDPSTQPVGVHPIATTSGATSTSPNASASPKASASPAPITLANAYNRTLAVLKTYPGLSGTVDVSISEAGGVDKFTGSFATNQTDPTELTTRLKLTEKTETGQSGALEIRAIGQDVYLLTPGKAPIRFSSQGTVTDQATGKIQLLSAIMLGNVAPLQWADLIQDKPSFITPDTFGYRFDGTTKDLGHADDELTGFLTGNEDGEWLDTGVQRSFTFRLDPQGRPQSSTVNYALPKTRFVVSVNVSGYSAAKTAAP